MINPFTLEGKTILVTGASSGLGQGIAIACAAQGAHVVLNGRNQERLEETFSLLEGDKHLIIRSDLSTQDGIDALVEKCPNINGVVHSAGISKISPVKHISRSLLEEIVDMNEIAPILLTASLLKRKKLQNGSSIVLIASISGVTKGGSLGESPYSATKGALSGFMKTAARELASQGIRVNTICPAIVMTPLLQKAMDIISAEELKQKTERYPLKRFGKVEDIANGAVYLLSDASSWVTGIDLIIDGGCHL